MMKDKIKAKILALENAAAFIGNHGEEGGIDQEYFEIDIDLYLSAAKKLSEKIQKEADKIRKSYGLT